MLPHICFPSLVLIVRGEQIGEKEAFFTDDTVFSYCKEAKGDYFRISAFLR